MGNQLKIQISRCALFCAILCIITTAAFANPWQYSLYTDKKGKGVGDVVTILILEAAEASNDTRTQTDEESSAGVNVQAGTGIARFLPSAGAGFNTDVEYDGKGKTSRNGELKATITAHIVQVMDNGNLLVEGSKLVTINDEQEVIEVSGVIRPDDIAQDNTVLSSKLAEAVIRYSGNGEQANAQKQGIFTRFFHWLF